MSNEHQKPSSWRSPVSVRLTPEERKLLEHAAGSMSLSRFIRFKLFQAECQNAPLPAEERLSPVTRQRLLAQILASMGNSGLAASLSELTELARLGLLPNDPELVKSLVLARNELAKLRHDLLQALGLRPKSGGGK